MRKLAGSVAIIPPEPCDHRLSNKGLELQRDIRRHNSQVRKIQHICWNCARFNGLHYNCKYVKDFSKCPRVRDWMQQNDVEKL